jgi:hypothetical protein
MHIPNQTAWRQHWLAGIATDTPDERLADLAPFSAESEDTARLADFHTVAGEQDARDADIMLAAARLQTDVHEIAQAEAGEHTPCATL